MSEVASGLEVRRETTVEESPVEVWEALTDPDRLSEWLAEDAELDLVEGGELRLTFEDGERAGRVESVEEERRLAFTWERPGYGESRVEFMVEAVSAGTRVIVVEADLGPGPRALAAADWWVAKLGALRATLALVTA